MAFYDEHKKVSRKEKVERAMMRGGFDDEGSRYSGKSGFSAFNNGNCCGIV